MGLKETLSNAVDSALSALGNVPKDVSYYRVVVGGYNVLTDTNTQTETLITCKGVMYKEKVETQDYKRTDLLQTKVLIAGSVFSTAGFTPDEQDYLVIDSVRYEIKLITVAPSEACYVFTVRAV
jgi:hypothetical protein